MEEHEIFKTCCCACLSKDRKLFLIHKLDNCLDNLFLLLSFESDSIKEDFCMISAYLHICWECKAIMNNLSNFCRQLCTAHEKLMLLLHKQIDYNKLSSISNLQTIKKTEYDFEIKHQNVISDSLDYNFIDCGVTDDTDEINGDTRVNSDIATNLKNTSKANTEHCEQTTEIEQELYLKFNKKKVRVKNRNKIITENNNKNENTIKNKNKVESSVAPTNNNIEKEFSSIDTQDYFGTTHLSQESMLESRIERLLDKDYLDAPIKCESCILGFIDKNEFDRHSLLLHVKKKQYAHCFVCQGFIKPSEYTKHVSLHYMKYNCKKCEYTSYNLKQITEHMKTEHCIDNTKVPRERRVVLNPGSKPRMNKPMMDKRTPLGFKCLECDKYFENKNNRWKHVQRMHRDGFACSICGKIFAFKDKLKKHEALHKGSLPREECPVCHKQIRSDLMKVHSLIHAERKKYDCEECRKTFASLATYEYHLKYTKPHSTADVLKCYNRYTCSICEKGYRSTGELRDHINYQHMGKTQHKCPVCNKALATRRCITRHIKRAHSGIKEQARDKICGRCGKTFRDKKNLEEHELTHTGERPLSCEICGATFRQNSSLYTHKKRIHNIFPQKKTIVLVEPDL